MRLGTTIQILAITGLLGAGCGSTKREINILTRPSGATLMLDGSEIGRSPLVGYTVDFAGRKNVVVTANMEGYQSAETILTPKSPSFQQGVLTLELTSRNTPK